MTTLPTQDAAVTAEEAKTMQDTPELPPLPDPHKLCGVLHEVCSFNVDGSKLLESHDNRYPVFTADQMREYVLADRATRPKGWKLVEDFHVGDRVIFDGVEHIIFALGDRPGTFDIQLPSGKGDRWRNVPPSALKYAAAPDAAPAASSPEVAAMLVPLSDDRKSVFIDGIGEVPLAYPASSPEVADPTDPGYDVDVLREHVRHLERRIRDLHREALASAPAGAGEGASDLIARIDNAVTDWNGSQMADEGEPRVILTCGELRAIRAALAGEPAVAAAADEGRAP